MAEVSAVQSDPNFAIVCSFIDRHGSLLNLPDVSFDSLQRYLEEARFVPDRLRDVLLLLLRKWKRSVKTEKWESTLIAFCYTYSQIDAWELEKFGFPRCRVTTKLRILKNLLELQFDCNSKFKEKINERSAQDLRFLPVGRDKNGLTYWFLLDKELNVVVYREEHDDVEAETWQRIVSSRDELARLIEQLETGESGTDKSGSATPAVTGSGASSDTEAKVPIKQELKTEDIVSVQHDTKTVPQNDTSLKEEPPDKTVKQEQGRDGGNEDRVDQKRERGRDGGNEERADQKQEWGRDGGNEDRADQKQERGRDGGNEDRVDQKQERGRDGGNEDRADQKQERGRDGGNEDRADQKQERSRDGENEDRADQKQERGRDGGNEDRVDQKRERGRDRGNEDRANQKHGVDIKAGKDEGNKEAASGMGNEGRDGDEDRGKTEDVKLSIKKEEAQNVKKEKDPKVSVKTENEHGSSETTLANGVAALSSHENEETVAPTVGDMLGARCKKGEREVTNKDSKGKAKDAQTAAGDKGEVAVSEKEDITTEKEKGCGREKGEVTPSEGGQYEVRPKVATSVTEKKKMDSKDTSTDGDLCLDADGDRGPCEDGGPHSKTASLSQSKDIVSDTSQQTDTLNDTLQDKNNSLREKPQTLTKKGEGKDSCQEKDIDQDKDSSQDKVSAAGNSVTNDVSKKQEDDKETCHSKDSVLEKQDNVQKKEDSLQGKQDSVHGKQDSVQRKQDSVQRKQDSVHEKQDSVHEKHDTLQEKQDTVHRKQDSVKEKHDTLQEKQDTVHRKQDSVKEKQENVKEKQDSVKEKQDNVKEKQDSAKPKPAYKEISRKEDKEKCHDKEKTHDKEDKCGDTQRHIDGAEETGDASHTAGDMGEGKIMAKDTGESTEKIVAPSKSCKGDSREEARKDKDNLAEESVSQRRKRPRRSDQLPAANQTKKDASESVADSSPISSDSEQLPSNHSMEEPPSKRQRAKRVRKMTRGGRQGRKLSASGNGKTTERTADSTEDECEKPDLVKPVADGNQGETTTRKRGRKTKRPATATPVIDSAENSCDSPAPLRRSSRANRGQRKLDLEFGLDLSKKRRGNGKDGIAEEAEGKNGKQPLEEVEEAEEVPPTVISTKKMKKKRRGKQEVDEEFVPHGKRRKKKRPLPGVDMSSDDDDDNDDEFLRELDEVEEDSLHWSSAASSVGEEEEGDGGKEEYQPKGRNAQRTAALKEKGLKEEDEANNCSRCGKSSHPELILLCDQCDVGYHTACLRPPLMLIPDGDWFCPTCEQSILLTHLQSQLAALDVLLKKNDRLVKRKERLAFVGISLDNILTDQVYECVDTVGDDEEKIAERRARREEQRRERRREHRNRERHRRKLRLREDEWEDEETEAENTSESSSEEEEQGWAAERRLRRCREQISYKFEEFDELIRSAIRDDIVEDAPHPEPHAPGFGKDIYNAMVNTDTAAADQGTAPSCGRGKDIENTAESEPVADVSPQPPRIGKDIHNASDSAEGDDYRPPPVLAKKKKKSRRLTGLSDDDEEEEDSGEEYHATDESVDSDANELEGVTEDSDDWLTAGSKRRRRRNGKRSLGTRRSSRRRRPTSKYDDDFVDDEEEGSDLDSDEFLPVRRAVVKSSINYREISESDTCSEYGSGASRSRRTKRRKSAVVSSDDETDVDTVKKTRHRRSKGDADDSDYHLSSDSGKSGSYRRQMVRQKTSSCYKNESSETENNSSEEKSSGKQKKRQRNMIESSEDESEHNNSESGHNSESETNKNKSESAVEQLSGSTSANTTEHIPEQPIGSDVPAEIKGQPDSWKAQNGSFMIENLLKETGTDEVNTSAVGLVENVSIDNHEDNSDSDLSGIYDLVKFVTQE